MVDLFSTSKVSRSTASRCRSTTRETGVGPGHRDIFIEDHLLFGADASEGISTVYYSFSKDVPYGASTGSPIPNLNNQMTGRYGTAFSGGLRYSRLDIRDRFSSRTPDANVPPGDLESVFPQSLRIVVGDMAPALAVNAADDGKLGQLCTLSWAWKTDTCWSSMATRTGTRNFGDSPDPSRPSIFNAALGEIMRVLGLNDPSDLPRGSFLGFTPSIGTSGEVEWVYPGNNDVVHGQHLYKPESLDVDLYNFKLEVDGKLNAEVVANRLRDASTLDARMALFRDVSDDTEDGNPRWQLVAVNDDYFGSDPFINLSLPEGSYALGVTAEGNSFDPNSSGHGSGGTTEGAYDLRIDFQPAADAENGLAMMDADGSVFDGDRDGAEGGNYNFWFNVAPERVTGVLAERIRRRKSFSSTKDSPERPPAAPDAPYNNLGVRPRSRFGGRHHPCSRRQGIR